MFKLYFLQHEDLKEKTLFYIRADTQDKMLCAHLLHIDYYKSFLMSLRWYRQYKDIIICKRSSNTNSSNSIDWNVKLIASFKSDKLAVISPLLKCCKYRTIVSYNCCNVSIQKLIFSTYKTTRTRRARCQFPAFFP